MDAFVPRALGAATALYSAVVLARPQVLAEPCGMTDADGSVPRDVRILVSGVAARDLAVGIAMAVAPAGPALRTVVAARIASDLGDAVSFGTLLRDRDRALKVAGVAAVWGGLNVLGWKFAGRR